MTKKTIAFGTLGCRLNQYESDSLVSQFKKNGYEVVSFNESADVYIVNTCTVTNKSDAKSRYMINKLHRQNKESKIFVTGCYAETDAEKVQQLDGVSYVIGNNMKTSLFTIVEQALNDNAIDWDSIELDPFSYDTAESTLHTRAYLKIQDGCNENCSYCKIPSARGEAISRPYAETIDNIQALIANGYKEIIFTGINIGDYKYNDKTLYDLLLDSLNCKGDYRIHISSIEPNKLESRIIELFKHDKMVKHIHLPLQSGSDRILKLMNRNYTSYEYQETIQKIRAVIPDVQITSDLMVGFPDESKEDFNRSYEVLKNNEITKIHTFKYSKRDATPASTMLNQINEQEKSYRSQLIRELSDKNNLKYRQKHLNRVGELLIEKEISENIYAGYDDYYIRCRLESISGLQEGEQIKIKHQQVNNEANNVELLSPE